MSKKTFIAKNYDSGLLHAYRYTGSHFKRRCGTTGRGEFIEGGSGVTKVSASWFVKQSDSCRKCKSTFDIEMSTDTSNRQELDEIAKRISPNSRSRKVTNAIMQMEELNCPIPSCGYSGSLASIAGHISGKKDEEHDWQSLGFEGANDFKRTISSIPPDLLKKLRD